MISLPDNVFQRMNNSKIDSNSTTDSNNTATTIKEDFQKTYEEVLNMFEKKRLLNLGVNTKVLNIYLKVIFHFLRNVFLSI